MKYKVGDCVRVQSLERYNKYKNRYGDINYGCETEILFTSEMSSFCGQVVTITRVRYIGCVRFYHIVEDKEVHLWVDGMFEGLVEEESKPKYEDEVNGEYYSTPKYLVRPSGYQFVDENGNVINATKIVLEKKKKEYPKTYEECCKVLNYKPDFCDADKFLIYGYMSDKLRSLQKLLICRNAYWKIAGEEMGLGKPWEPSGNEDCFVVSRSCGEVFLYENPGDNELFEFPTSEMRDTFKKNFDSDIEICKELL